jgi:hypothetical protein
MWVLKNAERNANMTTAISNSDLLVSVIVVHLMLSVFCAIKLQQTIPWLQQYCKGIQSSMIASKKNSISLDANAKN